MLTDKGEEKQGEKMEGLRGSEKKRATRRDGSFLNLSKTFNHTVIHTVTRIGESDLIITKSSVNTEAYVISYQGFMWEEL